MDPITNDRVQAALLAGYAEGDVEFASDVNALKEAGALGDVASSEVLAYVSADDLGAEIARRKVASGLSTDDIRAELSRRGL